MNRSTSKVGLIVVIAMQIKKTMAHFKELIFCAFTRGKKKTAH